MIFADMFARLTIFVRITPLAFSVESYEVIILEILQNLNQIALLM